MNTHTFGNHSVTCPICQRSGNLKPFKMCNGLFTCPYCQERLVVSWSGHYVRDPHNCNQVIITHVLRRQSRPWARIVRDFGSLARPSVILAVGSAILLGASVITIERFSSSGQQPLQGILEQVTDIVTPENSP